MAARREIKVRGRTSHALGQLNFPPICVNSTLYWAHISCGFKKLEGTQIVARFLQSYFTHCQTSEESGGLLLQRQICIGNVPLRNSRIQFLAVTKREKFERGFEHGFARVSLLLHLSHNLRIKMGEKYNPNSGNQKKKI